MKKLILFALLMGAMPLQMAAQDDDLYFVPTKKNVEKENAQYGMPSNTYYSGSKRTVDDYNRRAWSTVTPIDSTGSDIIEFSAVRGVYPDSASAYAYQQPEEDYQYTRRMSRFDGYQPSEAYWDGYRAGRNSTVWASWHDPWYWDYPYYYSSYYGWYSPWYYSTWYSPWRYGYYGYGWGPYYGGWYGGYYGGGGRYVSRPTTHRVQTLGGRNYGGYRTGTSAPTRNSGYTPGSNNGSSFGGTRSGGSSFGGSRSGGGSFGGGRSTTGGRSFGGRR